MGDWSQYFCYLIVGVFYTFTYGLLLKPIEIVGIDFEILAFFLLALVMGGYVSGMSFVAPKSAAALGGTIALAFLGDLVYGAFLGSTWNLDGFFVLFVSPAAFALVFSVFTWVKDREPLWTGEGGTRTKTVLGILAGLPILLATYKLVATANKVLLNL